MKSYQDLIKLFDDLQEREEKCLQIELECEKRNRNWDKELLKKKKLVVLKQLLKINQI